MWNHMRNVTRQEKIKKVVTGLVSVPVSLISCEMAWARDEGTCWRRLVDEWPSNFPALNPSHRNFLSLVYHSSSLGHLINYLLTEFSFRTVRYQDLGPCARTLQARSVLQDLGLNILLCEKQTQLINSKNFLLHNFQSILFVVETCHHHFKRSSLRI